MDWRERLLEDTQRVTARTAKSGPSSPWVGFLLRLHPDVHAALRESARRRNVSMATFARRAIIMAIAKDRNEPLAMWLKKAPGPVPFGNDHIRLLGPERTTDSGAGMEGMCHHPGCDQIHL